jgi:DnaJ-class molecular chaperone
MIEIIICKNCDGKGTVENRDLVDYHKGIYDISHETCHICKGSGRMKKTTTVIIEAYKP